MIIWINRNGLQKHFFLKTVSENIKELEKYLHPFTSLTVPKLFSASTKYTMKDNLSEEYGNFNF